MGKKYVVEIGRLERLYKVSTSAKGMPNMTWLSPKVDLTPYTEPDLEQVREEAYQKGLSDAWEAVRKIYDISQEDRLEIFPEASTFVVADICDRYSASECIEKIRQYEQKKEMDGLRQNIQTIVDQCGYTLDEIAEVLKEMRGGEQDG